MEFHPGGGFSGLYRKRVAAPMLDACHPLSSSLKREGESESA
jgi:hypothetical protein